MHDNASRKPDNTFIWRQLLENARRIDEWTEEQRKDYLFTLVQREFRKRRRWYQEIIKVLILDKEARQNFIRLFEIRGI